MEVTYKSDLNHAYLVVEAKERYEPNYQIHMLEANTILGILPVTGKGVRGASRYCYEISGKVSMKAMYEKASMKEADLRLFLVQLMETVKETRKYLLNVNRILLEPEYIFYGEGRFFFCYFPPEEGDMRVNFHRLTEYFVKRADYEDREAVCLVYQLHKETMEENYSMEQMIVRLEKEVEEEQEPEEEGQELHTYEPTVEKQFLREAGRKFSFPLRKKKQKETKLKWGDWDGLYMEEESE